MELAKHSTELHAAHEEIRRLMDRIWEHAAEIERRDFREASLAHQLERARNREADLGRQLEQMNEQLQTLDQVADALIAAPWWRLTSPLRKLQRRFRAVRPSQAGAKR
jgi:chromosome segregation ATPase